MKDKIKKFILNSNLYNFFFNRDIIIRFSLHKLIWLFYPKNIRIRKLVKKITLIDSISNYDKFVECIKPYINTGHKVSYFMSNKEKYPYGYYDEILNYAGIKNEKFPVFSELEHGIRFGSDDNWKFNKNSISFVFQGEYRFDEINIADNKMPKYAIGPYILYSRPYFDKEDYNTFKSRIKRTLLVFPSHTWEFEKASRDTEKLVDIVFNKYAPSFDSVIVCVYWNDINAPDIKEFAKRGAILVSAGFREDPNFVRRLRTIIEMSDAVVGDDLGTNIGYCLALNKPYYLECSENRYENEPVYSYYLPLFREAFYSENLEFSNEQVEKQQKLYRLFWGGKEKILESDKLKNIIKELHEECKASNYMYNTIWKKRHSISR